jgi:hypothetical protein
MYLKLWNVIYGLSQGTLWETEMGRKASGNPLKEISSLKCTGFIGLPTSLKMLVKLTEEGRSFWNIASHPTIAE